MNAASGTSRIQDLRVSFPCLETPRKENRARNPNHRSGSGTWIQQFIESEVKLQLLGVRPEGLSDRELNVATFLVGCVIRDSHDYLKGSFWTCYYLSLLKVRMT